MQDLKAAFAMYAAQIVYNSMVTIQIIQKNARPCLIWLFSDGGVVFCNLLLLFFFEVWSLSTVKHLHVTRSPPIEIAKLSEVFMSTILNMFKGARW